MIKTVGEFASEIKLPVSTLLEQLNKAGVMKSSPFDMLSTPDIAKLLDYLRRSNSSEVVKQSTRIRVRLQKQPDEKTSTLSRLDGSKPTSHIDELESPPTPLKAKPLQSNPEQQLIAAGLTKSQLDFLVRAGVPMERVFNAKGMGPGVYGAKMKDQDKWVAFNVSSCRKAGHTLRDRKGHCVQCDPSNISYVRRHDESGTVYVAFSSRTGLVKVGTATRSDRVDQLNSYRYGGASDWQKLHSFVCERAGKVESLAHTALDQFRAEGEYFKDGGWIACSELFKCDISIAVKAVEYAMKTVANK